jgi:hypothetical protein
MGSLEPAIDGDGGIVYPILIGDAGSVCRSVGRSVVQGGAVAGGRGGNEVRTANVWLMSMQLLDSKQRGLSWVDDAPRNGEDGKSLQRNDGECCCC